MNKDRLITIMLWVVFILGAAGLAGTYYIRSHHRPAQTHLAVERHQGKTMAEPRKQISPFPRAAIHKEAVAPVDEKQQEAISEKDGDTKRPSPPEPILLSSNAVIRETTKANGSFARAQQITEGVIIGTRGSKSDVADWYKIQSTGHTMIIEFDPGLGDKSRHFTMAVFDADSRRVGKEVGKARAGTSISVKPQSVYYLKLDLTQAPIQSPGYKVHVDFHDR